MPKKKRADDEEWSWTKILDHAKKAAKQWDKVKNDPEVKSWIESRPAGIKEMVLSHPDFQVYRVKEGAPYSGTHPGCIGVVIAYTEDTEGTKGVCSLKFGMLRAADNKPYVPIYAHLDPQWVEPVPMEEIKRNASMENN